MSLRCEEAVLGSEWVVSEVLSGKKSHKANVLVVVVHFHSLEICKFLKIVVPMHCI